MRFAEFWGEMFAWQNQQIKILFAYPLEFFVSLLVPVALFVFVVLKKR